MGIIWIVLWYMVAISTRKTEVGLVKKYDKDFCYFTTKWQNVMMDALSVIGTIVISESLSGRTNLISLIVLPMILSTFLFCAYTDYIDRNIYRVYSVSFIILSLVWFIMIGINSNVNLEICLIVIGIFTLVCFILSIIKGFALGDLFLLLGNILLILPLGFKYGGYYIEPIALHLFFASIITLILNFKEIKKNGIKNFSNLKFSFGPGLCIATWVVAGIL